MINNLFLSIIGLSFAVGSLGSVLPLHTLILFSIGMGVMIGGVFRELNGKTNAAPDDPEP